MSPVTQPRGEVLLDGALGHSEGAPDLHRGQIDSAGRDLAAKIVEIAPVADPLSRTSIPV